MRPPLVLVTPEEQAELTSSTLRALGENRERQCPRQPIGDPGLPGRPDPLIVALVEPEGALARCAEAVEKTERAWRGELLEPGAGPGALPRPRPGASVSSAGTVKDRLDSDCAALPQAIGRAVGFRAVCSPYLPGRRRLPHLGPVVRLLEGAAILAHRRAREEPKEAARRLLESLRFQQDLCRGGVPWIWPFVLRGPLRLTVAFLADLLASRHLDVGALASIEAALGVLAASEPPVESYLRGEQLTVELGSYLIPLMPKGWIPPGGEPTPGFDPGSGIPHRALGSPRQDLLLAWLALRLRGELWAASCSSQRRPAQCLGALESFNREMKDRVLHLSERWRVLEARLRETLGSGKGGLPQSARARRAVLDWLVAIGPTSTPDHLRRAAERPFWIAAMRVHLQALVAQASSLVPLDRGQVSSLGAAREDPFWGEPMRLGGEPGKMELTPPRELHPAPELPLIYPLRLRAPEGPPKSPPRRRGAPSP